MYLSTSIMITIHSLHYLLSLLKGIKDDSHSGYATG